MVREVSGVDVNRGFFSGELSDPSLVAGVLSSPSAEEIKPEEKSTSEDSSVRFADICESDILDDELMALDISVTFVGFLDLNACSGLCSLSLGQQEACH